MIDINLPRLNLKSIVIMGFTLLFLLVSVLIVTGLYSTKTNRQRLENTYIQQNNKLKLLVTMRSMARERVNYLFSSATYTDPFEQDEALIKFSELATQFILSRDKFRSLGLNREESTNLRQTELIINATSAKQAEVIELIRSGRRDEARNLLVKSVIPAQIKLLDSYNRLINLQSSIADKAIEKAHAATQTAYVFVLFVMIFLFFLGLLIAVFVTRRITSIETALFTEKELAEITLHSIADGVITTDQFGMITYINPVAETMTGWNSTEALNQSLSIVYPIMNVSTGQYISYIDLITSLEAPVVSTEDRVLIRKDGHEFAIKDSLAPIRNQHDIRIGSILIFNDVTEARNLSQQLSWQATHDPLTSLINRRGFENRLAEAIEDQKIFMREQALLFLDLDKFKLINDTSGHLAGDEFLRQFSRMTETHIRTSDALARLGGDEFAILLDGCGIDRALTIAEQVRQNIASYKFEWEEKLFEIGVSIGLVMLNEHVVDATEALAAADAACYQAKHEGRNQIQIFQGTASLNNQRSETTWVQKITQALEHRFILYYQDIIPTQPQSGCPAHSEILLRMLDDDNNVISPAAFIPAAERYGLMPSIDRWVLQHTLSWIKNHPAPEHTNYAINLSGHALGDNRFLEFVVQELTAAQLPAGTICFEITETAAISNLRQAVRFINTTKQMGCLFSLDDFGSGMSSYSYLKNLDVDFLKIDGSFVKNMTNDAIDWAMVESINRIGHVMNIKTIAEFVENDQTLQALAELNVDYAQGYAIHKPEPLPE
jgi:diguanylate cyclase (GGDEF)-like protein/PAS domain S-box-containing protein